MKNNIGKQTLMIAFLLVGGLSSPILFADQETIALKEKEAVSAETVVVPSLEEIVKKKIYSHFVEQQLFSNPVEKGSIREKFAKWTIPTLALLGFGSVATMIGMAPSGRYGRDDRAENISPALFLFAIPGIVAPILVDRYWSKKLNFKANNKDAFINFLNNWPTFKKMTPQTLHSLFDDLYEKMTKDELPKEAIRDGVNRFLEVVRSLLDETLKPESATPTETAKP